VVYNIVAKGSVREAEVVRCKNGASVNFMEDYMRRRDTNSMVISGDFPTDKPRFADRFGYSFAKLRQETMDWLSEQRVIMLPFKAGDPAHGYDSLLVCPANAAFFALALANMQGFFSGFCLSTVQRLIRCLRPEDVHPHHLRGLSGTLFGALPGAGATIASFLCYSTEQKLSKHPEKFDTGCRA